MFNSREEDSLTAVVLSSILCISGKSSLLKISFLDFLHKFLSPCWFQAVGAVSVFLFALRASAGLNILVQGIASYNLHIIIFIQSGQKWVGFGLGWGDYG